MDESTTAVGIDVFNEEQVLEITWEDGVISKYPLYGLRKNCPCVMCRGGHDQMQNFEPEAFFHGKSTQDEYQYLKTGWESRTSDNLD